MNKDKKLQINSEVLIQFFLRKMFEENRIDTDTYVIAMSKVKEARNNVIEE